MEISKRYNIRSGYGGGGWDRDGFLMWSRNINGKRYDFQVIWAPDNHGGDYRDMFYVYINVFPHGENYYRSFFSWKGMPTNNIHGAPVDVRPVPKYILKLVKKYLVAD